MTIAKRVTDWLIIVLCAVTAIFQLFNGGALCCFHKVIAPKNETHLLWHGASVYNGHLRWTVTLTFNAQRLAVELSLPVFPTYVCCGWKSNNQPSACGANSLTHCATAAAEMYCIVLFEKAVKGKGQTTITCTPPADYWMHFIECILSWLLNIKKNRQQHLNWRLWSHCVNPSCRATSYMGEDSTCTWFSTLLWFAMGNFWNLSFPNRGVDERLFKSRHNMIAWVKESWD